MFGCNYNQLLALAQVLLPLLLRPSARTSKKDNVKVQHIEWTSDPASSTAMDPSQELPTREQSRRFPQTQRKRR
ncbi:hypothetical protein GBAR_LOCUS10586 [Geodia barretti]|uniref:Secreted protein n=1 Tax=Geodia barretti TaxID=519541 RepID=A0AA35RUE3_GEOBA|nr:hypothetical protein GBAR_LOCUS10586 [Geodia barretti]